MASQAFRVLAFAYRYHEDEERMSEEHLVFVGMVAMIEHTYHKFHKLGMETVIYLIDKEHLSFMDNTNHPHHHPEQPENHRR